ncbi:MAG TPA: EpsI family protein [Candidatus Acidoferrales bacterium]
MLNAPPSRRLWITVGLLLGATLLLHSVSHGESVVARQPLRELPNTLGGWISQERPLQERIVQAVGVSDYTNRIFFNHTDPPVQLYVGYYASQRTGDTIHSPKNCLPGAGWDPIHSGYAQVSVLSGRQIVVNEYVIQQDLNKQMVFYWYQGRGRVIASEYWGKFWMVADAISRNRTDGALVRLVTPMSDGEAKARARLVRFTQLLFPHLGELIPN